MNGTRVVGLAAGAAALLWVGVVGAQQEMRPRPGAGSGVMDVNVINHPAVTAAQSGDWRVSLASTADVRIANTPTVSTAAPGFLRRGERYEITWGERELEIVTIDELLSNGWVRAMSNGSSRWLNLNNARGIAVAR